MNINKNFSYEVLSQNQILAYVDEEIKILNCDKDIFEEFLSNCNKKTNNELVQIYSGRFTEDEVNEFIDVLFKEKVLIDEKIVLEERKKKYDINIIYKGELYYRIKDLISEQVNIVDDKNIDDIKNLNLDKVVIVILDDVSYSDMIKVNEFLYKNNVQYIWIYHEADTLKVGPHVIPGKSSCYECYLTHRIKRLENNCGNNITIESLGDLKISSVLDKNELSSLDLSNAARMIVSEIKKIFDNGNVAYNMLDTIFSIRKNDINIERISFKSISRCGCCKGNIKKYYDDRGSFLENIVVTKPEFCETIKYNKGGLRTVSSETSKQLVSSTLKKTGLDIKINEVKATSLNDIIPVFDSSLKSTHKNKTEYLFSSQESHGKGIDETQAYFSAAFELFERLSARFFGEKEVLYASYNEVKDIAFNLELLNSKIINKNTPFDKFDMNKKIDWVAGYSLVENKVKLVPASMAFFTTTCFEGDFISNSSSGLAAGATLEDAIIQGLYELIEHDSWTIGQANKTKLPIVNINSSDNSNLLTKINEIEEQGYKVITRDYTTELGIPVFRTWIVSGEYENYATNGFGASLNPEIALERSVTEAVQSAFYSKDIVSHKYCRGNAEYLMQIPTSIYNMSYFIEKDIKRSAGETVVDLAKYKNDDCSNLNTIFSSTLNKLKQLGDDFDLIYVNLTKEHLSIPTVRIITTPHLQSIPAPLIVASDRLFSFEKLNGYSDKIKKYEDLYMGIYPH